MIHTFKIIYKIFVKIMGVFILASFVLSFLVLMVPRFWGITPDIVLSGSMEPAIQTGSICFVDRKANRNQIEVNDIISYRLSDEALVLHRVIDYDANGNFITKGDANESEDFFPISPEQIVGKAIFSIPYIGYVAKALQHRATMVLLLTLAAAYLFIKLINIVFDKSRKEETNEKVQ